MSDRRHQRDFSRSDYNKSSQAFYERIYGKWEFFKEDIQTGRVEKVKVGKAGLEINTAIFRQGIIGNVRQSDVRFSYFTNNGLKDVDWFSAVDELKKGAKIWTAKAVYWAVFTPPQAKQNLQSQGN